MDISSSSDSSSSVSPTYPLADQLALMKAAGTIDARVIKLLEQGMLLSSRLGNILTSNQLDYKPGDLLQLRLAGSDQNPLFKVSRSVVPPPPLQLDTRDNTQLNRILLPGRAMLASVIGVSRQHMQVQIDGVKLSLSLALLPGIQKGQLLTLLQDSSRESVEIQRLDAKPIFKALVAYLVSRQYDRGSQSSLVSFLGLFKNMSALEKPTTPGLQSLNKTQSPIQFTAAEAVIPGAARAQTKLSADAAQVAIPQSARAVTTVAQAPGPIQQFPLMPQAPNQVLVGAPTLADKLQLALRSAWQNPTAAAPVKTWLSGPIDAQQAQPETLRPIIPTRLARVLPGKPLATDTVVAKPDGRDGGIVAARSSKAFPAAQRNNAQSLWPLQSLLQSITPLSGIKPGSLKQWFELAGLLRPSTASPLSAINPYRLLPQLAGSESLMRELLQGRVAALKPPTEPLSSKLPAEEVSPGYIKEAIKLVEQALGQNLMQRALLGLQQETQQPLSLSLALPFIDEERVNPLTIELEQRNQAEQEQEKSWDIRVNFELAELGNISCHIILQGAALSASFYCERDETRYRFDQAIPQLRRQLCSAGFLPGEIFSFIGRLSRPSLQQTLRVSESLLDIEV